MYNLSLLNINSLSLTYEVMTTNQPNYMYIHIGALFSYYCRTAPHIIGQALAQAACSAPSLAYVILAHGLSHR